MTSESYELQGYNKSEILAEVNAYKPGRGFFFLIDMLQYHWNKLVIRFNLNVIMADNMKWSRKDYIN